MHAHLNESGLHFDRDASLLLAGQQPRRRVHRSLEGRREEQVDGNVLEPVSFALFYKN